MEINNKDLDNFLEDFSNYQNASSHLIMMLFHYLETRCDIENHEGFKQLPLWEVYIGKNEYKNLVLENNERIEASMNLKTIIDKYFNQEDKKKPPEKTTGGQLNYYE